MGTFWLKIAGLAIVIIGVIILISVFSGSETEPAPEPESKPKTIYEQWEKDEERLRAEPEPIIPPQVSPSVQPVKPRQPQFKKLSMEEEIQAQQKWEWVVNQRKMARLPVMGYKQMVDTCREIIRRWPKSKYAFLAKRALAELPERYHTMYKITKKEIDVSNFYEKD